VTTRTGRLVASRLFPSLPCVFFPVDIGFVMGRALSLINPRIVIIVETELWPNLLSEARRRDVPVVIVNGRVSPASYRWYVRFSPFLRRFLPLLSAAVMRTDEEASRLVRIGACAERVSVGGSMKFDEAASLARRVDPAKLRKKLGIGEDRPVIVFGSVHPGEEEGVVEICERLVRRFPNLLSLIAPRWLEKTDISRRLRTRGTAFALYTRLPHRIDAPVIVVDTYGELSSLYAVCEVAFVGGSLVQGGGQNPIEPAAFGRPVLAGPFIWHFAEEWECLLAGGGAMQVKSFSHLEEALCALLSNHPLRRELGKKAAETVSRHTGATEKTLRTIRKFL